MCFCFTSPGGMSSSNASAQFIMYLCFKGFFVFQCSMYASTELPSGLQPRPSLCYVTSLCFHVFVFLHRVTIRTTAQCLPLLRHMFLFSSARGMPPQSYRQDYSPVPPLGPFSSSPPGTAHSQMYLQPSASSTYPQHGTSTGAYPSTGAYTGTGTGPGSLPTPHYSQQQMTGSPRYMPLEIQHYRDGVTVSHSMHAPRDTTLQRWCDG